MITYKTLTTLEDIQRTQQLERDVWDMSPIPTHQTLTAIKNGGIMIGAFHQEHLIGFLYSFPGFQNDKPYLCSHMMGILPEYQSKGIGEQLKRIQRQQALNQGYAMIQWTFDPLQTRNAYLNLTKLRAICHTYCTNCYGDMTDGINKGLPSDRFEVHWHIASPHVKKTHDQWMHVQGTPLATIVEKNGQQHLELEPSIQWTEKIYTVPVIGNFDEVKRQNYTLALDWRLKIRKIFTEAFQKGYAVVALRQEKDNYAYICIRRDELQL